MTDPTTTTKHAARYHKDAAPKLCAECGGCRVCRTTRRVGSCENSPACPVASTATTRPEPLDGRLDPEALTARKRLAPPDATRSPAPRSGHAGRTPSAPSYRRSTTSTAASPPPRSSLRPIRTARSRGHATRSTATSPNGPRCYLVDFPVEQSQRRKEARLALSRIVIRGLCRASIGEGRPRMRD